ncbi:MAG: hypothetical protein K2P59_06265, partial [Acetatifactor sp.]|nr:hypothetical protein [Acetatifactor sp.]
MRIQFDTDWKFQEGDLPPARNTDDWGGAKARAYSQGVPSEDFDDAGWRTVELPHDFVSEKEYCFQDSGHAKMRDIPEMESIGSRLFAGGCLEGGVAWYRKKFRTDESFGDKRVYLHFDGVYRNSTLYCNQYYVGTHPGGYTGFYYDITDFLNIGGENIIAMRVDASDREGWWYEGGGIYRHVWMEVVDHVHVEPWGISVQARPDLEERTAALRIEVNIVNRYLEEKNIKAEMEILDPEGSLADKMTGNIAVGAWDRDTFVKKAVLKNVILW